MTEPLPKLQKYLAHLGVASRRKVEEMITEGKIQVNGQLATIGQRVDPAKDSVTVEGKKISPGASNQARITFLIYKPAGIVSSTSDELGRKTVVDFLQQNLPAGTTLPRLYPVGRLDLDSEGLMILTNDGALTNEMTHPSFEKEKTYQVTIDGKPTEKALQHLEKGVRLKEGYTAPAQVEVLKQQGNQTTLEITIHEGRYHQVKRMMLRVGYEVTKLIRVRMGEYSLDDLAGQKVIQLSASER
jgi:23S rRNA pseudouridine2605 synthase